MEYRQLGNSGLKISALSLGTMTFGWTADRATSLKIMSRAVDAGINCLDTADIYSRWARGNSGGVAESLIGEWLKGQTRDRLVIATKVRGRMGNGPNERGLSRAHIFRAAEASLRRLGTDYIDLYQTHWPDQETPLEETLRALDDLVHQGKVRYVGCSNFPAWMVMRWLWIADRHHLSPMISLQPHYNLLHRSGFEAEAERVCREFGLGVLAYSPLAGGFLTGKYERGEPPPPGSRAEESRRLQRYLGNAANFKVVDTLAALGKPRRGSPAQMALAWVLSRPAITSAIVGASSLRQIEESLSAADLRLNSEEAAALEAVSAGAAGPT
ncbi:MAG: aldo/keto reductase [Anaerolineae bacterium]